MRTSWAVVLSVGAGMAVLAEPALAEAEPSVTLDALLQAGREHHPTLSKQPLLAHSLELTGAKLNRAYWPQLSLNGQASWQSEVTRINIPIPGAALAPPSKDQYRATLDLKQNIWDGGVTADQKRVAESRSRVDRERVNVEWYQVRDRILNLYFAGIVQQELRAQGEVLQRYLGTVVDKAKVALGSGTLTERDVLLAQGRQLEAQQSLAEANAQLAGVRRSLEDLTGATLADGAVLVTPAGHCAVPQKHPPASTLRRPELDLLSAQGELLDAQEQLDRAFDLPRLSAFATAGYGRPGFNFLNDDFHFYFIGGLQLTVPLTVVYAGTWQNGREQLAVHRSLVARERDSAVQQVNLQLDTQTTELGRLDALIAVDEELQQVRERVRKQTELQLELGTATMTDLINDLTQEDQARSRRAVHHAQRNLACHQLALIKGE